MDEEDSLVPAGYAFLDELSETATGDKGARDELIVRVGSAQLGAVIVFLVEQDVAR